jgi:hypothetical protein
MQRFKIIPLFVILFLFSSFCGCSQNFTEEIISINYYSYIVQLDEYGKDFRTWLPKKGSIKIDIKNDVLSFIDVNTGKEVKINGSYKLIKIK